MITKKVKLKKNDVYSFVFNEEYRKNHFEPNHCFEGLLVVKEDYKDSTKLILEDTYWYSGGNTRFTLERALEIGELRFLYNLEEVSVIQRHEQNYYDDNDIYTFHRQHRCDMEYLIKKNTQRSKTKMISVLKDRIQECEKEIAYRIQRIENTRKDLEKVESGNLGISI